LFARGGLLRDQEPPEVDVPLPELDDGAEPELSPVELELEFELFELFELELELLDFELVSLDFELEVVEPLLLVAVLECVEPGSPTATAPAATTLAKPTATVVTFSRYRPRSRSAMACATPRGTRLLMYLRMTHRG
jgi:hypothetical protein